jgi:hypothetical protein
VSQHFDPAIEWIDQFDFWVDENTDEPAPGWTDNLREGGAIFRGYAPDRPLWSHTPGAGAISQFGETPGRVTSPWLDVNIDEFPIIEGEVVNYQVRDSTWGHDSDLHLSVDDGTQVLPLYTIKAGTEMPQLFSVDLRQAPTNWQGEHRFKIVLQLEPVPPDKGYSATYELDWIAVRASK